MEIHCTLSVFGKGMFSEAIMSRTILFLKTRYLYLCLWKPFQKLARRQNPLARKRNQTQKIVPVNNHRQHYICRNQVKLWIWIFSKFCIYILLPPKKKKKSFTDSAWRSHSWAFSALFSIGEFLRPCFRKCTVPFLPLAKVLLCDTIKELCACSENLPEVQKKRRQTGNSPGCEVSVHPLLARTQ